MFLHLSLHTPYPEKKEDLARSMGRFSKALSGAPGLIHAGTFETEAGELIGLTLWNSLEDLQRGAAAGRAAVMGDPFGEWESKDVLAFVAASIQK